MILPATRFRRRAPGGPVLPRAKRTRGLAATVPADQDADQDADRDDAGTSRAAALPRGRPTR